MLVIVYVDETSLHVSKKSIKAKFVCADDGDDDDDQPHDVHPRNHQ